MNGKHEAARFSRPVYKTSFSVTEELYESPTAKEPVFSRTLKGRFRIDLLRTLCVGTAVLTCMALVGLVAHSDR